MISLTERTHLPAQAGRVWLLFQQMEKHYADWHREHLRWRWLTGEPLARNAVWFAEEWVGPMHIASRFFVTESEPERTFAFRIGFPSSLVRAGGSFRLNPLGDDGCELIEEVHFGFSIPVIGHVVDLILKVALPIADLRRHIREEGEGMARLLEAGADRRADKSSTARR